MKIVIFSEVFLGQWKHFTKLSKNLIGGAEVYLFELAQGPLTHLYKVVEIYQTNGEDGKVNNTIHVHTVARLEPEMADECQLLITNNGFSFPPTSRALIKARLRYPQLKIINLHHGSIVKPTFFKWANLDYVRDSYVFNHPGWRGQIGWLKEVLLWEPRRLSIVLRMNFLTLFVDRVVSVDRYSLRYILPPLRQKWHVILNSADLSLFPPLPEKRSKKKVILVPRNLRYERGIPAIPYLAQAIKAHSSVPFEFWVTGTGQMEAYVVDVVGRLGLEAEVKLIGHQDHFKDMPDLYRQADIVLIPTFTDEGTSLSVIEAMASARPVVTTNVGGINDIGVHGVHKLSSAFNIQAISINLIALLEDAALARLIAHQAVDLVKQKHNLLQWEQEWEALLRSL